MSIRFATKQEINNWNNLILNNLDGGNVFQGFEFAEQKTAQNWQPLFIVVDNLAITVLEKTIFGLGKLWYIPKGPGVQTVQQLDDILPELKDFAQKNSVFVVKIEPELQKTSETLTDFIKLGLVRVNPIQPNFSTVTIDISADLESVMTALNQKGRHAIRRAERDGVQVKLVEANNNNCQIMYDLLAETATGQFGIRSYEYYRTFWQRYAAAGFGQLFFAYYDDKLVAAAFAIVYGSKSTYKDGASIRERTTYGASHLLQWRVIEWAKSKGSVLHDFCGAPPSDQINNPDHPHYGIGRFKTSFNKEVTDYVGAYDIVIKPVQYKIWAKIGERISLRLYYQKHHESFY